VFSEPAGRRVARVKRSHPRSAHRVLCPSLTSEGPGFALLAGPLGAVEHAQTHPEDRVMRGRAGYHGCHLSSTKKVARNQGRAPVAALKPAAPHRCRSKYALSDVIAASPLTYTPAVHSLLSGNTGKTKKHSPPPVAHRTSCATLQPGPSVGKPWSFSHLHCYAG
jgi:hypothetical protein